MDTTLSLYRIFYTVAQCGSISAAARHLYISQPAISKSISNLENELQTHLFERTSRGVSLKVPSAALSENIYCAISAYQYQYFLSIHQSYSGYAQRRLY